MGAVRRGREASTGYLPPLQLARVLLHLVVPLHASREVIGTGVKLFDYRGQVPYRLVNALVLAGAPAFKLSLESLVLLFELLGLLGLSLILRLQLFVSLLEVALLFSLFDT